MKFLVQWKIDLLSCCLNVLSCFRLLWSKRMVIELLNRRTVMYFLRVYFGRDFFFFFYPFGLPVKGRQSSKFSCSFIYKCVFMCVPRLCKERSAGFTPSLSSALLSLAFQAFFFILRAHCALLFGRKCVFPRAWGPGVPALKRFLSPDWLQISKAHWS